MPGAISEEAKTFGDNVRAARKAAGFSQEGFAYHCGLDRSYVGQVERGEKNVTLRTIVVLAEALKMVPADLLADI
jgi:transcriptional regulator with XRE-family HTH domain